MLCDCIVTEKIEEFGEHNTVEKGWRFTQGNPSMGETISMGEPVVIVESAPVRHQKYTIFAALEEEIFEEFPMLVPITRKS